MRSTTRPRTAFSWLQVIVAAVLMVATLPGRSQGLGLITEPFLADTHIDRLVYADINLWATLFGALACLPAGFLCDRYGVRFMSAIVVLLLAITVWWQSQFSGTLLVLAVILTCCRGLGQSALSVVSITAIAKTTIKNVGLRMAAYSVVLSVLFAIAFGWIGHVVTAQGWRHAWTQLAIVLACIVLPLCFFAPARTSSVAPEETLPDQEQPSIGFASALRTPAFWVYGLGMATFSFASAGLGLFNEAVLAEHGFGQQTYHSFLVVTTLIALVGQMVCGWIIQKFHISYAMAASLFLYAVALVLLPSVHKAVELWMFATLIGAAGGCITVLFFAIWRCAFGLREVGRIQGMAQILTVVGSATGPVLFAKVATRTGSYSGLLLWLALVVFLLGIATLLFTTPLLKEEKIVRVEV